MIKYVRVYHAAGALVSEVGGERLQGGREAEEETLHYKAFKQQWKSRLSASELCKELDPQRHLKLAF